ncbi:MAG: hypothetical protein IPL73_20730 [Candidatus Obscuribacter sp.]|nr:hypothetical protein [Candidatus Obscuribacter sp.]
MLLSIAGLCLYRLIPFYLSVDRPRESNLSLLHLNLLGHYNHDQKTMFDQLESLKPDIVLVSELCGGWEKFLDTRMLASYPYCDNLPVSGFCEFIVNIHLSMPNCVISHMVTVLVYSLV